MNAEPGADLKLDMHYRRRKWALVLLVAGWFPFGMTVGSVVPKLFHSYTPCFILMALYALALLITLVRALLSQCPNCSTFMGMGGLFLSRCHKCKLRPHNVADGAMSEIELSENQWQEYYRLKKSLFLFVLITTPLLLGGSMLLPLVGISSREYSPLVLIVLLLICALVGRRYIWYPCPVCERGYAGAQFYRITCPHCGAGIGYSDKQVR